MWVKGEKFKKDNRWIVPLECNQCGFKTTRRLNLLQIEVRCRVCGMIERNRSTFGKHRGVGELSRTYYNAFKHSAKRRGIEFSVSIEYLATLFDSQDSKCALSGLPIDMPVGTGVGGANTTPTSASLDRKDSHLGYVEGNVQWLNKYVNIMKNDLSQEQFISVCHLIAQKNQEPQEYASIVSARWGGGRKPKPC